MVGSSSTTGSDQRRALNLLDVHVQEPINSLKTPGRRGFRYHDRSFRGTEKLRAAAQWPDELANRRFEVPTPELQLAGRPRRKRPPDEDANGDR